ncbi:cadherin-99C [Biomphalaria pfeifferi]|uniref:Cadherin-99C n=1 Tax=Biomphalaria pfeifferi TaxID=112525 RepID=A0AAD8BJX2_BIOPF|nr:cadherin-99C [Biomphalaria pfeifferi]
MEQSWLMTMCLFLSLLPKLGCQDCVEPDQTVYTIKGLVGETIVNLSLLSDGYWSTSVLDITSGQEISSCFSTSLENETNTWLLQIAKHLPLNLRRESHDLLFTLHCTVKTITKPFIRRAILLPQPVNDQFIHPLVDIYIPKNANVRSILSELYCVLNVSATELSLTLVRDEHINDQEAFFFDMSKNGVVTLKQSLNSSREDIFLIILRRIMSSCTELVPVLVLVTSENSRNLTGQCENHPAFKLQNCSSFSCQIDVYRTEIQATFQGDITNLTPSAIYAEDSEGRQTSYFFLTGNPRNYDQVFSLHPDTGIVNTSGLNFSSSQQPFYMIIRAQVKSSPSCYDKVLLYIKIKNDLITSSTKFTTGKITTAMLTKPLGSTWSTSSTLSSTDSSTYEAENTTVKLVNPDSELYSSTVLRKDLNLEESLEALKLNPVLSHSDYQCPSWSLFSFVALLNIAI